MEEICGICRSEVSEPTSTDCNHVFCFGCISQWCNVSNSCPLCQQRFLHLYRKDGKTVVKPKDDRLDNWMQVQEDYDSEEQSIHTSDDEDEDEMGSEGDRYEADFVVPDGVIVYESGTIVDTRLNGLRDSLENMNPFGKAPRNQPDSIITTGDGQVITVSWNKRSNSNDAAVGRSDEEEDSEFKSHHAMSGSSEDYEDPDESACSSDEELPDNAKILWTKRR